MVLNKREDQFDDESKILFNHNHIVKFLERHKQFLQIEETIKVFIMSRKFRLSIQYLMNSHFTIDYFTLALSSSSLDIAFYLFFQYEDLIVLDYQKCMDALVGSYQGSSKLLKAKLHMTKTLLPIFTFNGAKSFLNVLYIKINETNLENNLFSHSSNPLLCMCLLYEFLLELTQKFFSLNNLCRQLNERIFDMALKFIESVEDEDFLTQMMLEQDYSNRDCLKIAVELELLDLIQSPKVESIILRIWNSDYDTSGSLLQMSTSYQIMLSAIEHGIDIEDQNRFYKVRDISNEPQSCWILKIFKLSMNARV